MSRLALIVSVTALAWLAGPVPAWGCIINGVSANRVGAGPETPVHPGDPVQFTISNLDQDANWKVSVGGREVGSETTAAHEDVRREFPLGDYGTTSRRLLVWVEVHHSGPGSGHDGDADYPLESRLSYEPRATPQAPVDEPAGDSSKPPPAASGPTEGARVETTSPAPAAPAAAVRPPRARAVAPTHASHRARPHAAAPRRAHHGTRRSTAPAVTVRVAPTLPEPAAIPAAATYRSPAVVTHRHRAAVRARARPTPGGTVALRRADDKTMPAVHARPRRAVASAPPSAWLMAGLAMLALLAGGGLGLAAVRLRRNRAPDVDRGVDLELDAELQEIIAEHRAVELTQRERAGVADPSG